MALKRNISLFQAIIYGVGVILGAGIYALIGVAAGVTGTSLWLSFIFAAIIASLTALSYAELSSRFPKEGAESIFAKKAFNSDLFSFFVGFIFLSATLFSVATVAYGFSAYAKFFFVLSPMLIALIVVLAAAIINFSGMRESIFLNNIFTLIEVLGLVAIIIFGLPYVGTTNLLEGANGEVGFDIIPGVILGISLVFFAFLGFEGIANISEEVKDAKRIVPKAILFSLLISTIIYILVALVAVSVVSPSTLAESSLSNASISSGPLALVSEIVVGDGTSFWLSIIALFATFNTVLILLIVASRYFYGLSVQRLLPKFLSRVNSTTHTPTNAIMLSTVLTMVLVSVGNLTQLGILTTMAVFLLFFVVNLSLIAVRFNEKDKQNTLLNGGSSTYLSPLNLGWFPLPAAIGALFCGYMFVTQYWQPIQIFGVGVPAIIVGLLLFSTSIPIYFFFEKKKVHVHLRK